MEREVSDVFILVFDFVFVGFPHKSKCLMIDVLERMGINLLKLRASGMQILK